MPSKSYTDYVKSALASLKGFQKMSRSALLKYIAENFKVSSKLALNKALKSLIASGVVATVRGSYKLATGQRPKKLVTKSKKKSAKKVKRVSKKKTIKKVKKVSSKKPSKKSPAKKNSTKKVVKKVKKTIAKKK